MKKTVLFNAVLNNMALHMQVCLPSKQLRTSYNSWMSLLHRRVIYVLCPFPIIDGSPITNGDFHQEFVVHFFLFPMN